MQLYNSLSRRKEEFRPIGDTVTLYVCGVTTSNYSHLGHALASVTFEVLHRYLEYRGYKVKRVQNFTDVDDKIIAQANKEGSTSELVAEKYRLAFVDDMAAFGVKPANIYPRATQEIPQIIDMISGLIEKGFAYEADGSVYYRVQNFPTYGALSGRALDEMLQGTRFDPEPRKEYPADFALWKLSKPGEPSWDGPWSKGRPGWHIECSAMARHHLGEQIDIHGGGLDLIFPHHENERAQSEAFTGRSPFARFWMHNGLLRLEGEKMSKSLGNIVRLRDALKRNTPDAIRLWFYSSHYRSPLVYDLASIDSQERAAHRLRAALGTQAAAGQGDGRGSVPAVDPAPYREQFEAAMDDDLNLPQGAAAVFELAREINRARDDGRDVRDAQATLRQLGGDVLGLNFQQLAPTDGPAVPEIAHLIAKRNELRAARRYADADAVRKQLLDMGVALMDSAEGTRWERVKR
ncbi:MAG: cysteine--tRNA ligase [Chloroflexi bacterium]|nr:cysteine--tRNA ligase [Chloroflexota bacterium]